jgi:hypothetical protein
MWIWALSALKRVRNEEYAPVGCTNVWFRDSPIFQNILPTSGSKSKPSKKSEEAGTKVWRWRRYIPLKYWGVSKLQSVTTQNNMFFIIIIVQTSNLSQCEEQWLLRGLLSNGTVMRRNDGWVNKQEVVGREAEKGNSAHLKGLFLRVEWVTEFKEKTLAEEQRIERDKRN